MYGYLRLRTAMCGYVGLCTATHGYALVSTVMHRYAAGYVGLYMHSYARLFTAM